MRDTREGGAGHSSRSEMKWTETKQGVGLWDSLGSPTVEDTGLGV